MSDPTVPTPVTPTATPVAAPLTLLDRTKNSLTALWTILNADLKLLWTNNKLFVIIFGLLILMAKGSSWLISFYVSLSKAEVNNATRQDAVLKGQEDAANSQANALINQADNLPSQNTPVGSNWDKK